MTKNNGSIDVTSYPGWENFTVNNFLFKNFSVKSGGSYNVSSSYKYDKTTGIFTFNHGEFHGDWEPGDYDGFYRLAEVYLVYID